MSDYFDACLEEISKEISLQNPSEYTKDYDTVRDYIINLLKKDELFRKLFVGHELFGSYAENVRINSADEFDLLLGLEIPFSTQLEPYHGFPGFYRVRSTNYIFNNPLKRLMNYQDCFTQAGLNGWFRQLIESGIKEEKSTIVGSKGDHYKIIYENRGIAHTIHAKCPKREFSFDLVPGYVFGQDVWNKVNKSMYGRSPGQKFYVVPKPICRGDTDEAFSISNPKAEHEILLGKQNLKPAWRLLKSLFKGQDMDGLKSYFIGTAFMWEVDRQRYRQSYGFFNQPISTIFLHMLDVICMYFFKGDLPFFWDKEQNLLKGLKPQELRDYGIQLNKLNNIFNNFSQKICIKNEVRRLFEIKN